MIITHWTGIKLFVLALVIIGLHTLCKIKCEIYMQSGVFSYCTHIIPISINGKYMCLPRRKYAPLNSQPSCQFLTSSNMIYAHTAKKKLITQLRYTEFHMQISKEFMKNKSMQLKDTCEEAGTSVMPVAINAWQAYPKNPCNRYWKTKKQKSIEVNRGEYSATHHRLGILYTKQWLLSKNTCWVCPG